ncbi:MAG: hypothetical protein RL385_2486 [Pseudomonadota bacterium]
MPRRTERAGPKPVRSTRADAPLVRDRLLDSAERLFAERGFHGASVRDITSAAEVGLAAINYHFNTKEELFRDVVLRRASVLNEGRLALLADVNLARGSQVQRVSAIATAYITPLLQYGAQDPGFRAYFGLMAQVSNTALPVLALLADHFNGVADRFVEALQKVYEDVPLQAVQHAYDCMVGSTLYAFSGNRRLESLARGTFHTGAYESEGKPLVAYIAGGLARMLSAAHEA